LLLLPLLSLLAIVWWTMLGTTLGMFLMLLGPLGRPVYYPFQLALAECCRFAGLRRWGEYFAPE